MRMRAWVNALLVGTCLINAPARAAPAQPVSARFSFTSEVGFDSNPLMYSDRDVRLIERGERPERFLLTSAEDFVYVPLWPRVELRDLFEIEGAEVNLALAARTQLYHHNAVLHHGQYDLELNLGELETSYSYSPDMYRRQYRSPVTDAYVASFYTEQWFRLGLETEVVPALSLRPRARLRLRSFDAPFGSRDAFTGYADLRVSYRLSRAVRIRAQYNYAEHHAAASAGQPDRSYREHAVEPGLWLRPLRRLTLSLRYRVGFRSYTTIAPPEFDPSYRDRHGTLHAAKFQAEVGLWDSLTAHAWAVYQLSQSVRPHDPGVSDEVTTWRRLELRTGLEFRFGR